MHLSVLKLHSIAMSCCQGITIEQINLIDFEYKLPCKFLKLGGFDEVTALSL